MAAAIGKASRSPGRLKALALGAIGGAAGAFFLDPNEGKRRRHVARDRVASKLRRGSQAAAREAEYRKGKLSGVAHEVGEVGREEQPSPNDQALADRVRSQVFRAADVPKGSVNVNVEDGVVYLRGEVQRPEQIEDLGRAALHVAGVRGVENLLHLPGTPAQTKA
jgi:hypothetical protein